MSAPYQSTAAARAMRTQVVIVGAGPAGTLLSLLLRRAGVESVVLEQRSITHVLSRIRAGVLEQGSVDVLASCGLGERLSREGLTHDGILIANNNTMLRVDFRALVDRSVVIYGQTDIQRDLYVAHKEATDNLFDEISDLAVEGIETATPSVSFVCRESRHNVRADFIVGCDGSHGVSRYLIPRSHLRTYVREYPFGWLGLLADTPPIAEELLYASHSRGFGLCSMRSPSRSRYYLQCPSDAVVDDWSDDRFWEELTRRLPPDIAAGLVTGHSIEKSITPLRSFVAEPMRYERLFLAGDAAHVVPPTGAKGLNLAISDVHYLAEAIAEHYSDGSDTGLEHYSERALGRVWKAVRFSWWMTNTLHQFANDGGFTDRLRSAEIDYLASSTAAQTALAENYVGLPL